MHTIIRRGRFFVVARLFSPEVFLIRRRRGKKKGLFSYSPQSKKKEAPCAIRRRVLFFCRHLFLFAVAETKLKGVLVFAVHRLSKTTIGACLHPPLAFFHFVLPFAVVVDFVL